MYGRSRLLIFSLTIIFSSLAPAHAEKYASIIIDDVGNNFDYGNDIIAIPAPLTIAILPNTIYAKDLARLATKHHKEVMLHLPMQSVEHHEYSPGELDLHMTRAEFNRQLLSDLDSVPYIRGVNNHMGSLLTRHPGHMAWLMDELSQRGNLYFVDSKTTGQSIADKIASEHNIPNLSRDFFLDADDNESAIRKQFAQFIKKINQRGYALAIAHPYPNTIQFLQHHLDELTEQGIRLIPVSGLIQTANQLTSQRGDHHVACTRAACTGL
jgi:polysaccharide deacetylase 2 family uncharacterized protein YibQ